MGLLDQSHARRAVNCAIEMRKRLMDLNQDCHFYHDKTILVGIALHSAMIEGGHIQLGDLNTYLNYWRNDQYFVSHRMANEAIFRRCTSFRRNASSH